MLNINKNINILYILIILDIITTLVCVMLGGIEYNPISLFFIEQSFILFVIIKLILILGIYILNNYTNVFKNKIVIISLLFTNIFFSIVIFLNLLYIILKIIKIIGMI